MYALEERRMVLEDDRRAFFDHLDNLVEEVDVWTAQYFLEDVEQYVAEVNDLSERCNAAWKKAEFINSNERIIGACLQLKIAFNVFWNQMLWTTCASAGRVPESNPWDHGFRGQSP